MKKALLLVDDDATLLAALRRSFKSRGYDVDVARDGREALEKLRGGARPDAIVSDIDMPFVTGLELVEVRNAEFPGVPVVLCSGRLDRAAAAAALGVPFFGKGGSPSELLEIVAGLVGG